MIEIACSYGFGAGPMSCKLFPSNDLAPVKSNNKSQKHLTLKSYIFEYVNRVF